MGPVFQAADWETIVTPFIICQLNRRAETGFEESGSNLEHAELIVGRQILKGAAT